MKKIAKNAHSKTDHKLTSRLGGYPAPSPCFGSWSLVGDNAGAFPTGETFASLAVGVPFTAETIWGNVASTPACLYTWDPVAALSPLVFPESYEAPADPYDSDMCMFRPQYTGVYLLNIAAIIIVGYRGTVEGHSFAVNWALVKGPTGTLKDITDLSSVDSAHKMVLATHAGISDSEIPVELSTAQIFKMNKYEEAALFAYFTSADATTQGVIDILVADSPGNSVRPSVFQFSRVA